MPHIKQWVCGSGYMSCFYLDVGDWSVCIWCAFQAYTVWPRKVNAENVSNESEMLSDDKWFAAALSAARFSSPVSPLHSICVSTDMMLETCLTQHQNHWHFVSLN